ncbi:hypothetical protein predicted by Glimmer/Critica [Bacteroides ovatus V975]|uniref:Uncharacterized protein n=1 Tax=Bacteroides ovatus (strain ATCC 8483 / DSM 1896 / JCM 5824 / BCRC 10623 / CCUG 4943 / NCTC 11153) TaxID=411476 RepID=A0AAN3AAX7_BACO1|nr:hypothetical protein BACOVA_01399 [Bacteroides ovatus ATCC 8483]CAG9869666.1 hypothetical protein BOVAC1_4021 [Bacteroides ovatus]SCV10984.1 hypothetical protein predicted by Glimmer/Critica [Bacteroides ovatus V975]CAG9879548.1 hypothetical protein BOVA115_3575 [Bacteroides ovatus]CAG9892459.1 hypothetical protein BOVA514_2358 [Bacteroides ovatus]
MERVISFLFGRFYFIYFLDNTGKVENGYPKPSFFVKIWMKNIECVMLEHIC